MSKARKITAFVMAAVMTVGLAATSYAALPSDVAADSTYEEAIETLGALKIMIGDAETGNFRPDAQIKRSEFAKVAVTTMGLGDMAMSQAHATKFPDVVENHWANGYINVATEQGIVIGDDEGNFRPDDSITYAEAMTMLVRLTGYEPSAKAKGGYPTGYLVVGSQNGISKNASTGSNAAASRGMVAQMTFNALTVKMMEQTNYGSNVEYAVGEKTLLKDTLNVDKLYGQITAVGSSSINGSSTLKDNETRIDGDVFEVADNAINGVRNLLGFNVVYYVLEADNGDQTLILARNLKNKNNSVTVQTEDIDAVVDNGSIITVEYWLDKENDKDTQDLDINASAKMIFNGKAIDFDKALLQPASGRIVALDQDKDEKYDIVFVTSFENYVVDEVIASSNRVTDKYGKSSLVLDPKDDSISFVMTKAGQKVALTDLAEWNVLSVAKSKDGKLINIEVSNNSVTGKVEEIEENKYMINGVQYKVAANYTNDIALGDEGTFYLDVEGKIAAVDSTSTLSSNYAYLVAAGITTGFDKNLEIKVFNKSGETKVITSGEKIKLNGVSGKTANDALAAISAGGNVVPQIITYETNANGVLTELDTATNNSATGEINKYDFTLNAAGSFTYKATSSKLGNYRVDKDTIVFDVPAGETDTTKYAVRTMDVFDDETSYDVSIFDVAEDYTAGVVLVSNSSGSANLEAPIAVIDTITTTTNSDDETVQKVYAYIDGKREGFITAEDGLLVNESGSALKRGDIIQMRANASGEIESIRVLFQAANKDAEAQSVINDDLAIVYGRVTKKFANSINVQVAGGDIVNYNINGVTVYEYNSAKTTNAIKVVEPGDIAQYDELDVSRVFIKIYKDEVKEIVIVK